ncbi:MAG: ABC transporter permease [Clostridiales bacterium]|nr:ABC transporter permease [Clostridiales bacterium]
MRIDANYLAVVFNSTLRMMTPILYVALGSAYCNRVYVFNIGLEGMMLAGAFSAIVANYYTHSVALSLLAAVLSSMLVALVAGIFIVKFKGAMLVVGVSINILVGGLTTFLMQIIFKVKGAYVSPDLVGLPKIDVSFLKPAPVLHTMFSALTWLDLCAFASAIFLYFFLFRTVAGFHIRSVGINKEAAESMGVKADRLQILTVVFSGFLSGVGGCLLSMGGVTMYAQNITAGRGFIAMAAGALGAAHPLGVVASSTFFGFAQSIANMLQNTSISSQLTMAVPYFSTIVALALYNYLGMRKEKKR